MPNTRINSNWNRDLNIQDENIEVLKEKERGE